MDSQNTQDVGLKRQLNLPLLIFYGLGTTIGAGIYVLVGTAAGHAGLYAPVAFILAAIGIAPTAASYAELAGRYPFSAAEAVYVEAGFHSAVMSRLSGLLVVFSGVVASAAITIGCAGYLRVFIDLPQPLLITGIVISMGLVAAWGILESVLLAALFTVIEAGGLIFLIVAGFTGVDSVIERIPEAIPHWNDTAIWSGIAAAGLLAVFAFIGFEDMVNVIEETQKPKTTMPLAIGLTLLITVVLYALVTLVAVLSITPAELANTEAPLSAVYQKLTGKSPVAISVIAIFATLNTILIQFIMASRVVYGMAQKKMLPAFLGEVSAKTHTPLRATTTIVLLTAILALAIPLDRLAEVTSFIILAIWGLADFALILIKRRKEPVAEGTFIVGMWVPVLGLAFCIAFLSYSALT